MRGGDRDGALVGDVITIDQQTGGPTTNEKNNSN